MASSGVTIIGLPALQAALARRAAAMKAAASAVVAAEVKLIAADARRGAPKGPTGDLQASIDGSAKGDEGEVEASARYGRFQEFGTSRHGAQPFMGPAAQSSRARFVGTTRMAMRRAVR